MVFVARLSTMAGFRANGAIVATYWSVLVTVRMAQTEITETGIRSDARTIRTQVVIPRTRRARASSSESQAGPVRPEPCRRVPLRGPCRSSGHAHTPMPRFIVSIMCHDERWIAWRWIATDTEGRTGAVLVAGAAPVTQHPELHDAEEVPDIRGCRISTSLLRPPFIPTTRGPPDRVVARCVRRVRPGR